MPAIFRILLFSLCIHISFSSFALTSPDAPEVLEKTYVQIDSQDDFSPTISIIKSFQEIVKLVRENSYSLLNWSVHSRQVLEIPNYDRKLQFGTWVDDTEDNNCYNTRAKVLLRDSQGAVVFKEANRCLIESGRWYDPYTTHTYRSTADIQIDHLVPLKNAYMSGASRWSFRARCLYANYLGENFHLLAVDGPENMKKGDGGPDRYMPPNKAYACTYIKNWLTIKFLWGLKMTQSEADAVSREIRENRCDFSKFRVSSAQILNQNRFFLQRLDLCDHVIPEEQAETSGD